MGSDEPSQRRKRRVLEANGCPLPIIKPLTRLISETRGQLCFPKAYRVQANIIAPGPLQHLLCRQKSQRRQVLYFTGRSESPKSHIQAGINILAREKPRIDTTADVSQVRYKLVKHRTPGPHIHVVDGVHVLPRSTGKGINGDVPENAPVEVVQQQTLVVVVRPCSDLRGTEARDSGQPTIVFVVSVVELFCMRMLHTDQPRAGRLWVYPHPTTTNAMVARTQTTPGTNCLRLTAMVTR